MNDEANRNRDRFRDILMQRIHAAKEVKDGDIFSWRDVADHYTTLIKTFCVYEFSFHGIGLCLHNPNNLLLNTDKSDIEILDQINIMLKHEMELYAIPYVARFVKIKREVAIGLTTRIGNVFDFELVDCSKIDDLELAYATLI